MPANKRLKNDIDLHASSIRGLPLDWVLWSLVGVHNHLTPGANSIEVYKLYHNWNTTYLMLNSQKFPECLKCVPATVYAHWSNLYTCNIVLMNWPQAYLLTKVNFNVFAKATAVDVPHCFRIAEGLQQRICCGWNISLIISVHHRPKGHKTKWLL